MNKAMGWFGAALVGWLPLAAHAQETITASPATLAAEEAATPTAQDEGIAAIVRGLYLEGRVGGGYSLVSAKLVDVMPRDRVEAYFENKTANQIDQVDEALGSGATVHLAIGYDLSDNLAVQGLVGAALVSGTRTTEPVRDVSIAFGGAGARMAFGLTDRLDLLASAGVIFVSATNAVEKSHNGVGVLGGVGLEYYVHVRHFSVGLDVSVLAPFSPMRLFVSVSPTLKYTFN